MGLVELFNASKNCFLIVEKSDDLKQLCVGRFLGNNIILKPAFYTILC